MIIIDNKFSIGQTVYLVTDVEQLPHIVISLSVYANGEHLFQLACSNLRSYHYDFELSDSINEELKIKNI